MTNTFEERRCERCNGTARLTRGGWVHGWPPAGGVQTCPGTGLYPKVTG